MKAVRFLAGLLAVVLIVVGVAVALLLGPDDTWGGEPAALPDSAPVVATAPQLLNVAGVELVVRAKGESGEVFVGAGHPVHVQDYLRDVTRTEITELSADGIGASEPRSGDRAYPAAPPAQLDVWDAQASGTDPQIDVPLTVDAPVQVVALPTSAKGPAPQVGIGYALPGAFVGGVVAALLGLLLLVGTILWGRRAKRAAATATEPAPATATEPAPGTVTEPTSPTLSRSATRVAAIGAIGVLAAGCSIPQQVDHGEAPGVVPLEADDAQAMLDDYDVRNNAAIKKSHTGDGSLWKTADTGPMLTQDEHAAKINSVDKPTGKPGAFTHEAGAVYASEQSGYPLWSGVETGADQGTEGQKGKDPVLTVYVKGSAASPWKGSSSVQVSGGLPEPLAPQDATPSTDDLARATQAAGLVDSWVEQGSADLTVPASLTKVRKDLSSKEKGIERIAHSADPWGGGEPSADPDGSVRVVRVADGLLVLSDHEWERRVYLDKDWEWKQGTAAQKVYGPQARGTVNDQHYTLTAATLVPDSGKAEVLGASVHRVLDFPR